MDGVPGKVKLAMAESKEKCGNGEEDRLLLEDVTVIDFDVLCATVASQTRTSSSYKLEREDIDGADVGGVQRMWEGGVFDCFDHRRIAIETACCPCYRFGKNTERASLGSCLLQAIVYIFLAVSALFNFIAFGVLNQHLFIYLGIASIVILTAYLGYFRTRIRKQFNIRGSTSSFGDCVNHLICPCCTLCQEARTLELNNVQGGVWRGRGDTICIGSIGDGSISFSKLHPSTLLPTRSPDACTMERCPNAGQQDSRNPDANHSEPVVSLVV